MLQLAKNIKNQRELELHTNRFGFSTKSNLKNTNFYEYFYGYCESKKIPSTLKAWRASLNIFKNFAGEDITFSEIDEKFCEKYLHYLQTRALGQGLPLSNVTIKQYFFRFSAVVKQAIKEKIIVENPLLSIQLPKVNKTKKVYLTLEELKLLVNTDCKDAELKLAFIFCCLTGLRWSDVFKLSWGEIQVAEGKYSIIYRQKKTQELNYLPLSEQSIIYLGERKKDADKVFRLKEYGYKISRQLQCWCVDAGVNKKITSSRHTFAVLQLSYGTSIYVVQKLLGHTDISSTQVYADIIDSEKERAMNVIPSIL